MRDTEHVAQGLSPESVAGFLLRLALGVLFLFAAVGKFLGPGPIGFAKWILQEFDGTYLPRALVLPYAFTLPYIEFLLGLVLILGLFTRASLFLAGMLLISLAFGKMVQQDQATVADNLNYVFMAAVALWFAWRDNPISVDRLVFRRGRNE
ncbi:MAG TPA: DoxX family membrane protein [Candidatus Hydrogenedentes bacterium]|nr:DoxX family membrane protein [Candidatus Hydrogenedentota bacterium]HQE82125.1 DoxX family membrane protein [Candidatus Hydrogenedentota bacterium]HQH52071.1 DoxX family membrane protein [Candidatus Hydrogenedentota bacterium]HQM49759.1 DoxX family membrane protein [Candidatus Hydrogenedentota bacterium]